MLNVWPQSISGGDEQKENHFCHSGQTHFIINYGSELRGEL